jgi:hypothetical protein
MTVVVDEFDLDLRLSVPSREPYAAGIGAVGVASPRGQANTDGDTCDLGCETQTCPEATCGCNTDTCDQVQCSDAITFGNYCEDASGGEDTCDACPPPASDGCPDPDG